MVKQPVTSVLRLRVGLQFNGSEVRVRRNILPLCVCVEVGVLSGEVVVAATKLLPCCWEATPGPARGGEMAHAPVLRLPGLSCISPPSLSLRGQRANLITSLCLFAEDNSPPFRNPAGTVFENRDCGAREEQGSVLAEGGLGLRAGWAPRESVWVPLAVLAQSQAAASLQVHRGGGGAGVLPRSRH